VDITGGERDGHLWLSSFADAVKIPVLRVSHLVFTVYY